MKLMRYLAVLVASGFLCNCIPHTVNGVQGLAFPTPFSVPSGIGQSPPLLNFLWGATNLLLGCSILSWGWTVFRSKTGAGVFAFGYLLTGIYLSQHYAHVSHVP